MNDMFALLKRIRTLRKYLFLLLLRAPFDTVRAWMLANLMRSTFRLIEEGNAAGLLTECVLYGLLCAGLFFYNGMVWSCYAAFAAKIEVVLQRMMFARFLCFSFEETEGRAGGEWITRLNSDIHAAFLMLNGPLNMPHLAVSVLNVAVSSLLLGNASVPVFLITWLFLLPYPVLNKKIVTQRLPDLKQKAQNALAKNTSAISPMITEADTIVIYDAGKLLMRECELSSRKLLRINMEMHVRKAVSAGLLQILGLGGYLVLLFTGTVMITDGEMTFAGLTYSFQLRGSVIGAVLMLVTCVNNIKTNAVCARRVNDTLNEQSTACLMRKG